MARQCVARGDSVVATARRPDEAKDLRATGARVLALEVADPASIEACAAAMKGAAIDILINNAGVSSKTPKLEACTHEELARVLNVNAIAPVLVSRSLLANVRSGNRKLIVNVTSVLGSIARNEGGSYGYRASKAALNMFTSCMAVEHRDITSVAMHPGWVQTDMGGAKAPLTVAESVTSMLGVMDRLTGADSGRFLNYDGTTIPW